MRTQRHLLFWLATFVLLVATIALLRDVLLPFVAGLFIAYFLNPLVDWLERLGLGRGGATAVIAIVTGLAFVLALIFLLPLLVEQIRQLTAALPADAAKARELVEGFARERLGSHFPLAETAINRAIEEIARNWSSVLASLAGALWSRGASFVQLASLLLVTPVVVLYLLYDWPRMVAKVDYWLPRDHVEALRGLARDIDRRVAGFIRGQGTVCLVLGVFYAAGLAWLGLRYGVLIGLATGLLAFVPYVGWVIGLVTGLLVALAQFGAAPATLAAVLGVFVAGQALDAALLSPRIVGERIGLHPVWLMLSLFAFGYLFGFVGVLVAVPLAAVFGVLVRFSLERYLASPVYLGASGTGGRSEGS